MNKKLLIIILITVLITISFSGCIFLEDSDPNVEFYYYVKVLNQDEISVKLLVPVPESNKITKDISVKSGNAMIEVTSNMDPKLLQIESKSPLIIISSSFEEFESMEESELSSDKIFCNISGNISIIIESTEILIYEGSDPHYFYHSHSIYNDSLEKELPTKNNCKTQLSDEYSLELYQEWNSYRIKKIESYRID